MRNEWIPSFKGKWCFIKLNTEHKSTKNIKLLLDHTASIIIASQGTSWTGALRLSTYLQKVDITKVGGHNMESGAITLHLNRIIGTQERCFC